MQYLVQMRLASSSRAATPQEGIAFIEQQLIFTTLDLCKKLQEEKKILAGGPASGAVALVLGFHDQSRRESRLDPQNRGGVQLSERVIGIARW